MGRKPTGRKYPKHISIQVKDEHNEDLKRYCTFLNERVPLDDAQWTIRDVVLTLLYSNWDRDPEWMVQNHFERLRSNDLQVLRKNLDNQNELAKAVPNRDILGKPKKELKVKKELKMSLNNSFSSFIAQLDEITGD